MKVVVALGKIAFDVWWQVMADGEWWCGHGRHSPRRYLQAPGCAAIVIASYHPSRQNTNTGKLSRDVVVDLQESRALLGSCELQLLSYPNRRRYPSS